MKRIIVILGIALIILVSAPTIIYLLHFHTYPLSDNTETWAKFGDYLNGVLTPIIAVAGIMITLSIARFSEQNKLLSSERQEMLQRPLIYVAYGDYEENLELNIVNKGLGPLIIKDFSIINRETGEIRNSIFDWIADIPGHYDNYTNNQRGLVLSPNEMLNLFKLTGTNKNFEHLKFEIRKIFKDLDIIIVYTDVYDKILPKYVRSLEWFGRNLD